MKFPLKKTVLLQPIFWVLMVFATTRAVSQTLQPQLLLSAGQQYTYQLQLVDNIKQTIYGNVLSNSNKYMVNVSFVVEPPTKDSLMKITTFFSDINYAFQLLGRDTIVSYPGKTGCLKRYIYSPYGQILQRGALENDVQGRTIDLENNLLSLHLYGELPYKKISVGTQWTREQPDSIYSIGMGGKIAVKSQTNYVYSSVMQIQNRIYAKISYQTQLLLNGQNNMDGAIILTEGNGSRNGEMLIDAENGTLYSDQNTLDLSVIKSVSGNAVMTIPINQQLSFKVQRIN